MAERDKSTGGGLFAAGALLGAFIGGAVALLLAPKAGKETQAQLKGQAKQALKRPDTKMSEMEAELEGRIDNLKVAARDLRGEAYEESQRLITRAEILKNDLEDSASRLMNASRDIKQVVTSDAKRLVNEGQAVIDELERMTRKIMSSARDKADEQMDNDGDRRKR